MTAKSYGKVVTDLAEAAPDAVAVVCGERSLTRGELEKRANRRARVYADLGVNEGDIVTLVLPNGLEYFACCLAIWKLGAVPNPLSHRLPPAELASVIHRAAPSLVIGVEPDDSPGRICVRAQSEPSPEVSAEALEDRTPPHERALASGGSTGLPKLIVATNPALYDPANPSPYFTPRRAALVPGPLYHAAPFSAAWQALFAGCKVVVMPRFDASEMLELIERHRVDRVTVVPTMMQRIWRLPREERESRDVSSLEFVMTGGAPCPQWLMRAWIEWLGPDVMHEAFGPSERIGGTFITGHEWLEHPGSVGKASATGQIKILDDDGSELPPGEMGEIFMLPPGGRGSTYRYVGAVSRTTGDGWESVGDMGYLDEDGYLYLGDRRSDLIITGGHNVYPAEVEAAIDAHPAVRSCAVIGLPDDDLGERIHAIVESEDPLDTETLAQHLAEQLIRYKIPGSFEFVRTPLRDDAGKVRRVALRAERLRAAREMG